MPKINEIFPEKCTKRYYQLPFINKFTNSNILLLCTFLTYIIDCALEKNLHVQIFNTESI